MIVWLKEPYLAKIDANGPNHICRAMWSGSLTKRATSTLKTKSCRSRCLSCGASGPTLSRPVSTRRLGRAWQLPKTASSSRLKYAGQLVSESCLEVLSAGVAVKFAPLPVFIMHDKSGVDSFMLSFHHFRLRGCRLTSCSSLPQMRSCRSGEMSCEWWRRCRAAQAPRHPASAKWQRRQILSSRWGHFNVASALYVLMVTVVHTLYICHYRPAHRQSYSYWTLGESNLPAIVIYPCRMYTSGD